MTLLALVLPLALAAAPCPERTVWPGVEWTRTGPPTAASVDALDGYLFPPRNDQTREGIRTDGIVIVRGGELVYERYGADWTATSPHLLWSAAKSFTNALVGIAQQRGSLDINDSICDYVESPNPALCNARVVDFLEFASGIGWRETYENEPPTASSVLAMLWGEGRADAARFVLSHGVRDAPGTSWEYSSGDTNVLAAIAGKALTPDNGEFYPWAVLFDPIGITRATWERDGAGTYLGSSYVYMPPQDMARFGYLLLNDGCWEDRRLLPSGWVADSTQVNDPIRKKAIGRGPGDSQGRQFWLNQPVPEQGDQARRWPDVPATAYAAMGHWKQSIWVLPEQDLVIAYTADTRDGSMDYNTMIPLAIAVANSAPKVVASPVRTDGDAPTPPPGIEAAQ